MLKPRKHQVELVEATYNANRLGVIGYHGMGLGKTYSSLLLIRKLLNNFSHQDRPNVRAIVLCPKSAIITWKAEIANLTPDLRSLIIIQPYSQMHSLVLRVRSSPFKFCALIMDECHYLKTPTTDRVKTFAELLKALQPKFSGKVLPITGTPMPNTASEVYTMWSLVSSEDLVSAYEKITNERDFLEFQETFSIKETVSIKRKTPWTASGFTVTVGSKYTGAANEDKLYSILAPFTHYRRAQDCIDLPEMNDVFVNLEIDDDLLLKNANIEEPDAYMSKLERISTAKTPYAVGWLEEFLKLDEQLVIFSLFTKNLRILEQRFQGRIKLITGRESQAEREKTIQAFQQKKIKVVAMSYGAGAESLNFQNANNTLYLNYPWNHDKLDQAKARTHRSGQVKKTNHYFLMSGENDKKCYDRVMSKKAFNDRIRDSLLNGNPVTPEEPKKLSGIDLLL